MSQRPKIFAVTTAYPHLDVLVLHADTWHGHVIVSSGHVEMKGMVAEVEQLAKTPDRVFASTTKPGALLFVSASVASPSSRTPLALAVEPQGSTGIVTTAHYKRIGNNPILIWQRSDQDGDDDA